MTTPGAKPVACIERDLKNCGGECAICMDWLYQPKTVQCGHSFCLECIKEHRLQRCPTCRAAMYTTCDDGTYNHVMASMLCHIGGDFYKSKIREREERTSRQKTLNEFTTSVEFRYTFELISRYIDENPMTTFTKLMQHMSSYAPYKVRFILYQMQEAKSIIVVHSNGAIYNSEANKFLEILEKERVSRKSTNEDFKIPTEVLLHYVFHCMGDTRSNESRSSDKNESIKSIIGIILSYRKIQVPCIPKEQEYNKVFFDGAFPKATSKASDPKVKPR